MSTPIVPQPVIDAIARALKLQAGDVVVKRSGAIYLGDFIKIRRDRVILESHGDDLAAVKKLCRMRRAVPAGYKWPPLITFIRPAQ
jgi:hypothetical protein